MTRYHNNIKVYFGCAADAGVSARIGDQKIDHRTSLEGGLDSPVVYVTRHYLARRLRYRRPQAPGIGPCHSLLMSYESGLVGGAQMKISKKAIEVFLVAAMLCTLPVHAKVSKPKQLQVTYYYLPG